MSASSPAKQDRPMGVTLLQAAEAGDLSSVKTLIPAGANVNSATESGMTALMCAAANGHLGLVSLLLEHGADIHARRSDGLDALALAVFFGHQQVVRELLSRGADVKAKDRFSTSPEIWATVRGFHDIADILTDAKSENQREVLASRNDESKASAPERSGEQEPILAQSPCSDELPSHETETSPIPAQTGADSTAGYEWSIGSTDSSERTMESPASVWTIADDAHKGDPAQLRNRGTIAAPTTAKVKNNTADNFASVVTKRSRVLTVHTQPSSIHSTYVAKPRYHHKRKGKLVRWLAYLTSDWRHLTVLTLIVMVVCGLSTFAFLKLIGPIESSQDVKPASVAEPSAPELPDPNAPNYLYTTGTQEIPGKQTIDDASGQQLPDSAKRSVDVNGPQVDRIKHPSSLYVAERSPRKSSEKDTGVHAKQDITPKRETQVVSRPDPSSRSARTSAKEMPASNTTDLTPNGMGGKAPPHAAVAPLKTEIRRPRRVAARNNSPAPAASPGRHTKTKVIPWP